MFVRGYLDLPGDGPKVRGEGRVKRNALMNDCFHLTGCLSLSAPTVVSRQKAAFAGSYQQPTIHLRVGIAAVQQISILTRISFLG